MERACAPATERSGNPGGADAVPGAQRECVRRAIRAVDPRRMSRPGDAVRRSRTSAAARRWDSPSPASRWTPQLLLPRGLTPRVGPLRPFGCVLGHYGLSRPPAHATPGWARQRASRRCQALTVISEVPGSIRNVARGPRSGTRAGPGRARPSQAPPQPIRPRSQAPGSSGFGSASLDQRR